MAITSVKTGSSFTNLQKYDSFLAGNAAYDPSATFLIQRIAGTGASGTITFSSIPGTYKALQIRTNMIGSVVSSTSFNFNGDTGSNYSFHGLFGNSTGAVVNGSAPTTNIQTLGQYNGTIATYPNVQIMDIIDYASTSKYKTTRCFQGFDKNAAGGEVGLTSGSWRSTSAITSITFAMNTGVFNTGTTIALYGVK